MKTNANIFDEFKAEALAAGFDEALERHWAPGTVLDTHGHPFDAEAVVVQGEMWLTCDGNTRRLLAGDTFSLARDVPHAERYGPEGATYWVARRSGDSGGGNDSGNSGRQRGERL